jgi:hypothetical protein
VDEKASGNDSERPFPEAFLDLDGRLPGGSWPSRGEAFSSAVRVAVALTLGEDAQDALDNAVVARLDRNTHVGVLEVHQAALVVPVTIVNLVVQLAGRVLVVVTVVAVVVATVVVTATRVVTRESKRAHGQQTGGGGRHDNSSLLQHSVHLLLSQPT